MIEIRFNQQTTNLTSPIAVRFEFVPELTLEWGGINIDVDTGYSGTQISIEFDIGWSINRVDVEFNISFNSYESVDQETFIGWRFIDRHATQFILGYSVNKLTITEHHIGWQISQHHATEITTPWSKPVIFETVTSAAFTNNKTICESAYQSWFISLPNELQIDLNNIWRSGADQSEREYGMFWGPHRGRWICSTNYRPQKGKVTIRFATTVTDTDSPIVLRFVAEPEVCYYDDGGGPIDSGTDLPNFDFDIPIEPQIRRVYLMQPQIIVTRVSDGLPIVVDGLSISDTRGQFTKSGSIDFSSKIDRDRALNELLLVEINGYDFYLLPEEPTEQHSFGRVQYSARCRSRTAQLMAPWRNPISYSNTVDRSVAGIMGDILTASGWSVELVGFLDFNVPSGVFTITGKAPGESINEIADMIGCIVVPDEFTSVLKIVPRWPVTPWNISGTISAVNIHDAVITSYNVQTEFNLLCDSCWVRGEQQGVSRHVKRTGTAGNIPTADISNSLIVSDTPARLVGTAAIADTGKKNRISVNLPIMVDLPPLVKGMLIGVTYFGDTYKATCDSVNISVNVESDGSVDVSQSVNLIRHLE